MNNYDNNHNNIIIIKVKGTACKLNKEMNKINNKLTM